MIDPDTFEGQVLHHLLDGDHPLLARLREQATHARVREIEASEYGALIDLWVEDDAPALEAGHRWAIDDLFGRIEGLDGEVGYQLHLVRGRIRTIEAWISEPGWPANPVPSEFWYVGPDPDPEAAERIRLPHRDVDFGVRGIEGDPAD